MKDSDLRIAEASTANWYYHLVRKATEHQKCGDLDAICGKRFTGWETGIPVSTWESKRGPRSVPAIYCAECTKVKP